MPALLEPPDTAIAEAYARLQTGSLLLPLGPRTQLEITGADRVQFLNSFCTGDLKKLKPGEGCEAFITNHQGKAAGHGNIFAAAERLLLIGAAGQAEKLIAHFDKFVISEQITFNDQSQATEQLLLAGSNAETVLQSAGLIASAGRLVHQLVPQNGVDLLLARVDYLASTPAFLFSVSKEQSSELIAKLTTAGAISPPAEVAAAVCEMARVEAGYPLYGQDITEDNLPQEVQRDAQAISFTKGCYLGQETIARLDALGHVNRVLTGLKFPTEAVLQPGETIVQGDKKLAQVTSLAWSPKLQSPLVLAYVRTLHATPGKRLAFAGGEAEVVRLPLE